MPRSRCVVLLPLCLLLLLLAFTAGATGSPSDSDSCLTTFSQFDADTPLLAFRTAVFTCPASCLPAAAAAGLSVYGSYPYHAQSGLCLAALHSGLINDSQGGGLFVHRFLRQDWSGGLTQTVFPFGSAVASLSNGVQSLPVPDSWHSVPAAGTDFSFTVSGRGQFVTQRRTAPWSGRSGHLHLAFPMYGFPRDLLTVPPQAWFHRSQHLVIGGRNATHYLNDVWLGQSSLLYDVSDLDWTRLPDAPFAPRADLSSHIEPFNVRAKSSRVWLFGGQTAHACGLPELGVCSDDVWQLRMDLDRDDQGYSVPVNFTWGRREALPTARCGAALAVARSYESRVWLVGGQLSYTDPSCSQPVITMNDVWFTDHLRSENYNVSSWRRAADAPFSPRRSQRLDDALMSRQDWAGNVSSIGTELNFPLVGGMRVLQFSSNSSGSRLQRVEVFADVWGCFLHSLFEGCRWGQFMQEEGQGVAATTSVPLPTALAAARPVRNRFPQAGPSIGGFTSREAAKAWLLLRTQARLDGDDSALPVNVTLLVRPTLDFPLTADDVANQRGGLPMAFTLEEDELNDAQGDYQLGTSWLQSHGSWMQRDDLTGSGSRFKFFATSLHWQPASLAVGPEDASWWLPQPASSLNTTRPLFSFPLRRLEHASDSWNNRFRNSSDSSLTFVISETVVSGGRSGQSFLSDWLSVHELRCLPPNDPSFLPVLGPLTLLVGEPAASYAEGDVLVVQCQSGHHAEPAQEASEVELTCAPDGLWQDYNVLTIRRCVPDTLRCRPPLQDRGLGLCEPPLPSITSLWSPGAVVKDALSVTDLPVLAGRQLFVNGSWFSRPVVVTVGGVLCEPVELIHDRNLTLCFQRGVDDREVVCDGFTDQLTCSITQVLIGINLPVAVISGRFHLRAETDTGGVPTVSSIKPMISSVNASACDTFNNHPLHLTGCPITTSYNLSVCAKIQSVGAEPVHVLMEGDGLPCSDFDTAQELEGDGVCALCSVSPRLGTQHIYIVREDNLFQSVEKVTVTARPCPRGELTDFQAALDGAHSDLCIPCGVGSAPENAQGSSDTCLPCRPGHFANESSMPECRACAAAHYAPDFNSSSCLPCPVNSFQPDEGQQACVHCQLGEYVVYADVGTGSSRPSGAVSRRDQAQCSSCPEHAACEDGNITAVSGWYVMIDDSTATVSTVPCWTSACISRDEPRCDGRTPQTIVSSQLSVVNCCGPGRYDAFTDDYSAVPELRATRGVNVLCAVCLPGHTQINGRCIPCASVQWGALTGVLLVALLLVFLLHRFPHDWQGSARMVIIGYFLQISALFLSSESAPQMLSLLNVDLLGTGSMSSATETARDYTAVCIVPLQGDYARFTSGLVSPLLAFLLLAVIAVLHFLFFLCLRVNAAAARHPQVQRRRQSRRRLYEAVFVPTPTVLHPPIQHETLWSPQAEPRQVDAQPLLQPAVQQTERRQSVLRCLVVNVRTYQRTCVRLIQLSYAAISLLTLRFFHIRSVGVYGSRLVEYPGMDPSAAGYRQLLPVMIVSLNLFVFMLPVVLTAFLLFPPQAWTDSPAEGLAFLRAAGAAAELGRLPAAAAVLAVRRGLLVDEPVHPGAAANHRRADRGRGAGPRVGLDHAGQLDAAGAASEAGAIRAQHGQYHRDADAGLAQPAVHAFERLSTADCQWQSAECAECADCCAVHPGAAVGCCRREAIVGAEAAAAAAAHIVAGGCV